MKTLIIHPDDRSTDFLRPIYQNIKGATVLTKNISNYRLKKEIQSHDQILMLGHGSPYGLLNLAGIGDGLYAVGEKQVPLLRNKQCIFIWCNADVFVKRYQLKGLYTGMFISEVKEAEFCRVPVDQETVDVSNSRFADILGGTLTDDSPDYKMIFEHVKTSYEELATVNKIANYNNQRWYFEPEVSPTLCSKIKGAMQKILFLAVLVSSLSSCSPYVYEITYYQGIENTGVLASSTLIYMPSKDNNCWDWYKETPVFKEMMPKSDSVTILYWGTRKELRALGR
jgi:hypothetical protein